MYCKHCGKEIFSDAVVCIHCGRALNDVKPVSEKDTGNIGWAFLGFFVPIVGLILYLIWKDEQPKNARAAGKGALIYVIVAAVIITLYIILFIIFVPMVFGRFYY